MILTCTGQRVTENILSLVGCGSARARSYHGYTETLTPDTGRAHQPPSLRPVREAELDPLTVVNRVYDPSRHGVGVGTGATTFALCPDRLSGRKPSTEQQRTNRVVQTARRRTFFFKKRTRPRRKKEKKTDMCSLHFNQ